MKTNVKFISGLSSPQDGVLAKRRKMKQQNRKKNYFKKKTSDLICKDEMITS